MSNFGHLPRYRTSPYIWTPADQACYARWRRGVIALYASLAIVALVAGWAQHLFTAERVEATAGASVTTGGAAAQTIADVAAFTRGKRERGAGRGEASSDANPPHTSSIP